jgi:sugar lactone lactonase YvrE
LLGFLVFAIFSACNNNVEKIWITEDFIDTALFTSGIEGPAFDMNGNLYVVNFKTQGTIGIVDKNAKADLFVNLPVGSIGNGIRFDPNGDMYIADYKCHNILKVNMQNRQISVFAHDSLMNQPNDLTISPQGYIFASDPNWTDSTGKLWRVDSEGKTSCLDSVMGTTNGVEVNQSGDKLYVNESIQRKIWLFDLSEKGEISNKRLFYQFNNYGLDGMRFDKYERLFVTRYGKGEVVVFSKDGKILHEIKLKGQRPTNLAFGGTDNNYCYVTDAERKCIERFKIE